MSEATPVIETPVTPAPVAPAEAEANGAPVAAKVSPAQDLRDIQALLTHGVFPGNVAPAIIKAFQLLEKMAVQVESEAAK